VRSQSCEEIEYQLHKTEIGWTCSCPDSTFRKLQCKHAFAVLFSLELRKSVESSVSIEPLNVTQCIFCHSENIRKKSIRHNKAGDVRRYLCLNCGRWFSFNLGFEGMKATPQIITTGMQLYFSGQSLRSTAKSLILLGAKVSYVSVYNWIKKYVSLMQKYLDEITPQVSDTWRTDELYLKIRGNMKYLFAMMDDQTRFWIAQLVADNKGTSDVRPMFREAKEIAEKKPKTLISDGARNFHDAYLKEYWTMKKETRTEHIAHIRLAGDKQNNKMEHLNGELRDREKVMRSLKTEDTPILKGMQIFHNFVRPHTALEGKTPSEACGIKVNGENKWMTLIQNASKEPSLNMKNLEP
jgi:transposase-like protein